MKELFDEGVIYEKGSSQKNDNFSQNCIELSVSFEGRISKKICLLQIARQSLHPLRST